MTEASAGANHDAPLKRQPPGLWLLSSVEAWERFSFYGMKAFLVLFLTSTAGGFAWTKQEAATLYAWYSGLIYLTPLLGGYLADRVLGTHKTVVIGSFTIAAGHFCMAVPGKVTFFVGLSLIVLGTGCHKSNIATMVGQLFKPGDKRRDPAFTIYYMGVNLGAFFGPLICGAFAESQRFGWHWGFGAAGVGMVVATVLYLALKRRALGEIGDRPAAKVDRRVESAPAGPLTGEEKDCLRALALLGFFNIFFWSAFEQVGSSMNFFAAERTARTVLGFQFPVSWFQSVNPVTIILCAPLFAAMWTKLAARGREPSTPMKFVWALLLLASGFVVLVVGAGISDGGHRVSPLWLVGAIVLHTWGELCLSPVGLSTVTKLAPVRFGSLAMGAWYGSFFLGDLSAGLLAGQIEKIEKGHYFHVLGGQADFFLIFVVVPSVAAIALWALSGRVNRLMHGRA